MPEQRLIRYLLVALALFALIFAATLGAVWHTHGHSSDANCSICHLNHQQIDHPLSCDRLPSFAPVGDNPEAPEPLLAQAPVIARVPARAPPAV